MDRIYRWFFDNQEEKDGGILPYSRADIAAVVVVGLAMMVIVSCFGEAWTKPNLVRLCASTAVAMPIVAVFRKRRLILGAAMGLVAARLTIALIIGLRSWQLAAAFAVCWFLTWILLREIE